MHKEQFKPFTLVLKMKTPFMFTDFAPTLDGLLFEALSKRFPEQTDSMLCELLRDYLAFNEALGVYHASSAMLRVDNTQGLMTIDYARPDVMGNKMTDELFSPKIHNNAYVQVRKNGGATKTRMSKRPAYAVPYITFDAFGDANAVSALLDTYVMGIGYDAQNCNCGAFDIETIFYGETDLSLCRNGKANRPLPAHSGLAGETKKIRLLPPYYHGICQVGVTPARIRVDHIQNL